VIPPVSIRRQSSHKSVDTKVQAESVFRIGEFVADNGIEGEGDHQAARDLLMAVAPRLRGQALQQDGEPTLAAAMRGAMAPCRIGRGARAKRSAIIVPTAAVRRLESPRPSITQGR
jgi:hypothetical protein